MTTTNNPLLRLKQHSGLEGWGEEIPNDTLAGFTFQVRPGERPPGLDLDTITADIIDCLEVLNRQVNQEAGAEAQLRTLDPQMVYAASGIVLDCLDKALELRRTDAQSGIASDLLRAAWRVQCAWDALLAGDIENLQEHVAGEEWARGGEAQL